MIPGVRSTQEKVELPFAAHCYVWMTPVMKRKQCDTYLSSTSIPLFYDNSPDALVAEAQFGRP